MTVNLSMDKDLFLALFGGRTLLFWLSNKKGVRATNGIGNQIFKTVESPRNESLLQMKEEMDL